MSTTNELFTQIAREHLGIQTLQTQNSDRLDFHEVAVWQIAQALEAAYRAGTVDGQRRQNKRHD